MSTTIEMLDPRGKTFEYWSKLMAERLAPTGLIGPGLEREWQRWAREFVGQPGIMGQGVPSPAQFRRWSDWARAMLNYPTITF
jgi:hypothetical protein